MKDIINDLKRSATWKIQLIIAINFIPSKYTDEERVTYSKTENIESMIINKADEVIEELFQSLLSRYQIGLEISMKGYQYQSILPMSYNESKSWWIIHRLS